jgi:hypothetical protein
MEEQLSTYITSDMLIGNCRGVPNDIKDTCDGITVQENDAIHKVMTAVFSKQQRHEHSAELKVR